MSAEIICAYICTCVPFPCWQRENLAFLLITDCNEWEMTVVNTLKVQLFVPKSLEKAIEVGKVTHLTCDLVPGALFAQPTFTPPLILSVLDPPLYVRVSKYVYIYGL